MRANEACSVSLCGRPPWIALAAAAAFALTSCAYYNAMYNANKWAAQAERSERAGRTAEARERWQRAALHAESLLARHRESRWADDALLVRGRALVRLERWSDAVVALREAAMLATDEPLRVAAWLEAGRAYSGLRLYQAAAAVLDSALAAGDRRHRSDVLLWRGRARLRLGEPRGALDDFRSAGGGPDAWTGALSAALALGDTALAIAMADSLAAGRRVAEASVLPLLDTLASLAGADAASAIASRLAARGDLDRGVRARAALADAERLNRMGQGAVAMDRLALVLELVPDSSEARTAAVRLLALELRQSHDDSIIGVARDRLIPIEESGGTVGREASQLLNLLQRVDSLSRAGDAGAFLSAELLRDSLFSPGLAARAYERMAADHPLSPWAPKAMLAAIGAGHPAADSLRSQLEALYSESPYAAMALGREADAERYAVLEDSPQAALQALVAAPDPDARERPGARPRPGVQPRPGARPRIEP